MFRFIKIVFLTTVLLLVVLVTLFQAMEAPQRQENKIIPNAQLPR